MVKKFAPQWLTGFEKRPAWHSGWDLCGTRATPAQNAADWRPSRAAATVSENHLQSDR
jgi:hypothetical protein